VFQVTPSIYLGPYPLPATLEALRAAGVRRVLNVADGRGRYEEDATGFAEVAWHPVTDLQRIPPDVAAVCLQTLHRLLHGEPDAKVYVHCAAGQNRSPTVIWLYLIAAGLTPEEATLQIEGAAPDAIPGHPKLVDDELVAWAREFGIKAIRSHLREGIL
jgi:dual specificity protein phosphatase-like protein